MKITINTITQWFGMVIFIAGFSACEQIEETYAEYNETRIYSPKVNNLEIISELKKVTLTWDLPVGDVAQSIMINYNNQDVNYETLIDSVVIENLEIQSYEFKVYTLDVNGNRSIPESVSAFPNGE